MGRDHADCLITTTTTTLSLSLSLSLSFSLYLSLSTREIATGLDRMIILDRSGPWISLD